MIKKRFYIETEEDNEKCILLEKNKLGPTSGDEDLLYKQEQGECHGEENKEYGESRVADIEKSR